MARIPQRELDAIVSEVVAEYRSKRKRESQDRVLVGWRVALQKEPLSLKPFQIDQIMREVQAKLIAPS